MYDLIFFGMFLVLSLPLIFTYRFKNRIVLWLLILIPPFLLTPLTLLPARGPQSMMLWLPAIISFLVSVVFLTIRTFQLAKKRPVELLKIKFIRPALVVLLWIAIGRYHNASAKQADSYAIALAKNFQAYCDNNGFCVASIPGWRVSTGLLNHTVYYSTNIQTLGISYPLRYGLPSDGNRFEVILVHGFNMELCVKGGIGKDLEATYYYEGGQVQIPVDYHSQHLTTNSPYFGK